MRRTRRVLELLVLVVLVGAWAVTLRPQSLGGPALFVLVRGDSMEPAYRTNDLVVVRAEPPYVVGDVVAYRVPDGELGAGRLVLHRIVDVGADGRFTLLGDNNPAPDPWRPDPDDVAGRVWIGLPGAGQLLAFVLRPVILAALAAAIVVAAVVSRTAGLRGIPGAVPAGYGPGDGLEAGAAT